MWRLWHEAGTGNHRVQMCIRDSFNGNPQDNYPDALDKYRKLMKENKWELGEDDEELRCV